MTGSRAAYSGTSSRSAMPVQWLDSLLRDAQGGQRVSDLQARLLAAVDDLEPMLGAAGSMRDAGHGDRLSYSRKVFIPLTKLCRDSCHYCTFARPPSASEESYLSPERVLAIARAGRAAGCKEALFTLGDKPELRYRAARDALARLGFDTTLRYLEAMAKLVLEETGLLPHLNPGILNADDLRRLKMVSVSMGLMLETASPRLSVRGGPHFGSPDKVPAVRLTAIAAAGEADVPFTTGLLIGIGETRAERVDALLALRELHERHGHIQEIIIQNFRAKSGTRMAQAVEPSLEDHLWTVAVARIIFGSKMTIQAPPNLSAGAFGKLIEAGVNDCGGISPVTIDHVNPEAPWPEIEQLARECADAGKVLVERLALHPAYLNCGSRWLHQTLVAPVLKLSDADNLARTEAWTPGHGVTLLPQETRHTCAQIATPTRLRLQSVIERAGEGRNLTESEVVALFAVRGDDYWRVCEAADAIRKATVGDGVAYVVTRNINYTNVCAYKCQFCAFSKGKLSEDLRGQPYNLDLAEIERRVCEAWNRGATEVCLQGGIHPGYTGDTYLSILRAVKKARPAIHVHAFSPLEVWQGANTLGMSLEGYLAILRDEGLGSLPGTAAEILDDEVRRVICPDKLTTEQWLSVMETAHRVGLKSTSTIMFGHVDRPHHWARHLLALRSLQQRTSGFTEFVPLPFVPMQTPIYRKGRSRYGPTAREAILMHAVARLALNPVIKNIQVSWVKMGAEGALACLNSGANDLGGTLMNETISRAAGALHGQELSPLRMQKLIRSVGRAPRQRTTLYLDAPAERRAEAESASVLAPVTNRPAKQFVVAKAVH